MKKLTIISAIALSGLFFNTANAQIRLGLRIGPVRVAYTEAPVAVEQAPVYDQPENGYDYSNDDDYYYLPEVDAYYDVNANCYFYNDGENWISAAYLPGEYRDYDWRSARRYEIRERNPFMHNDVYRSRYNGHEFREWSHRGNDNHFDRDAYRRDDHRNDNIGINRFGTPQRYNGPDRNFYNHQQYGYGQEQHRNNDRFDNRGFGHPQQNMGDDHRNDNRGQGGFGYPQQNRGNDRNDNRGQGGFGQPQGNGGNDHRSDNHGGFGQPSSQNDNHNRDNRSGNDHFAQNRMSQGGFSARNMKRF